MTATNHALTGAILGALLPLPIAIPLAFASHFVMDTFPHYGIPQKQRNKSATYHWIVFADGFVALSLLATAVILHKWRMGLVGLVAYSPDSLWLAYYYRHHRNLYLKPHNRFMRFHIKIQRLERPWGIAVDLLATAILLPIGTALLLQ